jgi:DNA-binding phage protein
MKTKTTEWKIEDYLKTPEQRAFYIEAAIDEAQKSGDMAFLATALSDVASAIKSNSLSAFFSGVSTGLAATKQVTIPATHRRSKSVLTMP